MRSAPRASAERAKVVDAEAGRLDRALLDRAVVRGPGRSFAVEDAAVPARHDYAP
jgi:hypothetical protein